ncbi:hypothetical protein PC111_g19184 [Phytophthora cactorum]|nr:hypothetical protein PC111_g19184 [Phytophthora cactorum]KAG2994617.1 hypothetical protein PC120_g21940 [Phytophthora cactorum]
MSVNISTKTLPSGAEIPVIGLGVYKAEPGAEDYTAVLSALKLGYRHIDTAQFYQNEADVGRAVCDSELITLWLDAKPLQPLHLTAGDRRRAS